MTKAEKVRQAASDMGFDDPNDMLEFLRGVGLEVAEIEPSHTTRAKLAAKQAREAFVHRAAIAFATHPQFDQSVGAHGELTTRPYLMIHQDAVTEAVALWDTVQKELAKP